MALQHLLADPYTRSVLGRAGLEELSTNLWPGACQTCGQPLGDAFPAVQMVEGPTSITATLHHPACQRQRWTRQGGGGVRRYLTTTTELRLMPFGDPGTDPFLPTLLANPGLEEVTLAPDNEGRYRAVTVENFSAFGLVPPSLGQQLVQVEHEDVSAWCAQEKLIVRCGDYYWVTLLRDPSVSREIERFGGVVLAVSTALNPRTLRNPQPIKRVLATRAVALGFIPLNRQTPMPELDGHSVVVDSDLFGRDETNDFEWLPEQVDYPGPSFDLATGRFELGMGMDGPVHWQLLDDDRRPRHGLIIGPAERGKTSAVRLVVAEAYASLVFDIAVVDCRGREELIDPFRRITISAAGDVASATVLLKGFADLVRRRQETPATQFVPLDTQRTGVLVAIDDAALVFADSVAAEAAEYIAVHGPAVGIALLVATDSADLASYGNRPKLLQALLAGTAMPMTRELFDQLGALRREYTD